MEMNRHLKALSKHISGAAHLAANRKSFVRLAGDFLLYKAQKALHVQPKEEERCVLLKGGVRLTYKSSHPDIWAVHQMWIDQVCRLPVECQFDALVDLGANIGMASLWLSKQYQIPYVIAVEPVASNISLAKKNLDDNEIRFEVLSAAVGPSDGEADFSAGASTANGFLSLDPNTAAEIKDPEKYRVRMMSMLSVLQHVPAGAKTLVKVDIEGGEQALFTANCDWLEQVEALIVEFHLLPQEIDYIVNVLHAHGFYRHQMHWPEESTSFFSRSTRRCCINAVALPDAKY